MAYEKVLRGRLVVDVEVKLNEKSEEFVGIAALPLWLYL